MKNLLLSIGTAGCLFFSLNANSQDYYNAELADSLADFSDKQWLSLIDSGYDMNTILSSNGNNDDDKWTVFQDYAHSYGYYCQDDRKKHIFKIIANSEEDIINPFFFMNDACGERSSDILEYFSLLHSKEHPDANEKKFQEILEVYFHIEQKDGEWKKDYNGRDKLGKTPLMYAAEFGYSDAVKFLVKNGAKVNVKDKNGKTAVDYTTDKKIKKLIKKAN